MDRGPPLQDVGGWDYGDNVQNLSFYDTGIELETRMESSGTSYQEYSIKGYSVERQTYYYKCCPEPYSNLIFRITFERPARYYFWLILLVAPNLSATQALPAPCTLHPAPCTQPVSLPSPVRPPRPQC